MTIQKPLSTIKDEKPVFNFIKWGNGPKAILAFHGFGQNATYYKSIAEKLGPAYTVFSFDLFFHGDSVWPYGDKPLTKRKFGSLMVAFLEQNNIDKFSVIGFSLGAKFALSLYELFPVKIEELTLIAPEGIRINIWYKIATGSFLARLIFKYVLSHPALLLRLVKIVDSIHLLNPKVASFVLKQMESEENRKKVYHSWVVFRKLKTKISYLTRIIQKHGTQVLIYLGRLDKVITINAVKPLIDKLPDKVELKMLNSDHNRLLEAVAKDLKDS